MVQDASPDPPVATDLAAMLAETSLASPGATGVQPSVAASGESSFLTTLDAVADGGGVPNVVLSSRETQNPLRMSSTRL